MIYTITVNENQDGKDIGGILRSAGFSHRLITSLKRVENGIMLNGVHARTVDICRQGDVITLRRKDEKFPEPNFDIKVPVLFENDRVIVFDKPCDMPVHESIKHRGDTLANVFAAHCPNLSFRSVNRLDRDTCGCVICAKDAHAAKTLQRSYRKKYVGICIGVFIQKQGRIDAPIARERESIITRTVREDGQSAVTEYRVIAENERFSLVEFTLLTGRTHQIRVHMSHIGHPIAGDGLYGGECAEYPTLRLCCESTAFILPDDDKETVCRSNYDFKSDFEERY